MNLIGQAIQTARKYYDENTFYHAMRVAAYVADDNLVSNSDKDNCIVLAIMHDLLEDTDYKIDEHSIINHRMEECLKLLTKDESVSYNDYLKNIKENYVTYPEAYWVKLADMKDHLSLTDTLTDKLKEKYLSGMRYLL